MNNILISKEDIINLLEKSFEDGYNGYLDNKEDCINKILNNYLSTKNFISSGPNYNNYNYNSNLNYGNFVPYSSQFTVTTSEIGNQQNPEFYNYTNTDTQTQFNFIQGDLNG